MVDDNKSKQKADPSLEPTSLDFGDSTSEDLEALLRAVARSDVDTFHNENEYGSVQERLLAMGPPQVTHRAIGQYELVEQIGRGGMGEVWKARHRKLNRVVAIKLLHPSIHENESAGDRFQQEIRAIGTLQHDNIVQALDADEVDGVHYLAMELIEGRSVSQLIAELAETEKQMPVTEACRIVSEAAKGLHYAHQQGIVHRDIKPSNIMLTEDGNVKLLDLGLARIAQSDNPLPELTREGQVMGTVDYMPPEQLRDSRTASVPADVYALGATFYKLLTGRAPFATDETNSVESKILAIASDIPNSVASLRPDVPQELSQLIDETLRKDPSQRPGDMVAFQERLRRAQSRPDPTKTETSPVSSRSGSKPVVLIAGAALALLILLGGILIRLKDPKYGDLVIVGPDNVRIIATRTDDPTESYVFVSGEDGARLKHGTWEITILEDGFKDFEVDGDGVVRIASRTGDKVVIRRKSIPIDPPGELDANPMDRIGGIDWGHQKSAPGLYGYATSTPKVPGIGAKWQILPAQNHFVDGKSKLSPLGNLMMTHTGNTDPYLRVFERRSGRLVCCAWGVPGTREFTFAPDESKFIAARRKPNTDHQKAIVSIHDLTGRVITSWESRSVSDIQWSPNGDRILLSSDSHVEQRTPEGKIIESFIAPDAAGLPLRWSPSGDRFAVCQDGNLVIYPADGGSPLNTIDAAKDFPNGAFWWHPSGKKVLTFGDSLRQLRLWDLQGNHVDFNTDGFLAFSPDGRFFVTNHGEFRDMSDKAVSRLDWIKTPFQWGPQVRWHDPDTLIIVDSRRGHGYSVEVSPTGRIRAEFDNPVPVPQMSATITDENEVVSIAGYDGTPTWSLAWAPNESTSLLPAGPKRLAFAAFAPDGGFGLQASDNVYKYSSTRQLQHRTSWDGAGLISFNHNGTLLAEQWNRNEIRIWQADKHISTFSGAHSEKIVGLAWAPERNQLLAWDDGGKVCVWDPAKPEQPIIRTQGTGFAAASTNPRWSPNGKHIAIPTKDSAVVVDQSGKTVCEIKWEGLARLWWQPDGQRVLVGSGLYDLKGKQVASFSELDTSGLPEVRLSNNGTAIGWWHRTISFWDKPESPPVNLQLPGFDYSVYARVTMSSKGLNSTHISPDGQLLLANVGVVSAAQNPHGRTGDISLVDINNRKHLWTGVAFSDGQQIRIDSDGKVLDPLDNPNKYLTYLLRYDNGRILSLTPSEFASRIGMTEAEQLVQELLDFGATLTLSDGTQLVGSSKTRNTPVPPESVVGIDLSGNTLITNLDLADLRFIASLQDLDLSKTSISELPSLVNVSKLRTLNLAGTQVQDGISSALPKRLEQLDLSGTQVGDFLMGDLQGLTRLHSLVIRDTYVTQAGISRFKQAVSQCRVTGP